jgi:hypothetical protein
MGLFARVEDRRAIDLDVEAPAEDEAGQDRVGGRPQLLGGEARPGRRLRAVLLEGDPLRRQERQDRERDDDDRGRQADQDGRGPAAIAFTRSS